MKNMSYEEFKKNLLRMLRKRLRDSIKSEIIPANKNNGILKETVGIENGIDGLKPIVYVESLYDQYCMGADLSTCVSFVIGLYREIPDLHMEQYFESWEAVKPRITMRVVNWEWNKDELRDFKKGFIKPLLYLVPIVLILILVQDHLSATIIIVLVVGIMMLMAGVRPMYFATVGSATAVAGVAGLYAMAKFTSKGAFRIARITSFLNPWADKQGDGWQVIQSLYAIGSGGLFGVGLGQSKQKYLYISEPHTDFIFAVLAEELGFVGCAIVIALFGIFIWRGVLAAMKAPDMFGSLVAVGITSLIGLQAIINIAVVTSSMPVTGMPLPFFSYGVTSLLILLCSVGILLNISRAGSKI